LAAAAVMDKQIAADRKDFAELEPGFVEPTEIEGRSPFESRQHLERINSFDSLLDSRLGLSNEILNILEKIRGDEEASAKRYDDEGFALDEVWSLWFVTDAQGNTVLKRDPSAILERAPTIIEYNVNGGAQEDEDAEYDPLAGIEDTEPPNKKPRLY
jgi:hypothetical protein